MDRVFLLWDVKWERGAGEWVGERKGGGVEGGDAWEGRTGGGGEEREGGAQTGLRHPWGEPAGGEELPLLDWQGLHRLPDWHEQLAGPVWTPEFKQ